MKLKQRHTHYLPTLFALALFFLAISVPGWGDDKHKPAPASKPQSKPAQTSHSSGGNTSHGGNTGRPSGSSSGRPSGGSANGRPSGGSSNGNTSHASGGNSNGRPGGNSGSNNGRSTNNAAGNNRGSNGGNNANNRGGNNSNTNNRGGNANNNNRGNNANNNRGGNAGRGGSNARREPVRNVHEVGGRRVATDGRGRVREISGRDSRGRDLAVHRDVRGGTRFETRGAGGRRIVGYGHGRGFTERRFVNRGGHVYVQRTYVYGGRRYAYAYRSYYWHGNPYYGYAPAFYFHPGFYGWAYNPWAAPVYYNWGWGGNPWFVGYGYYFNPYPVYPSASLWLTDYLLAESLKAAYEARSDANANAMQQDANDSNNNGGGGNNAQVALSPEVKQMIADEVKRQLDAERNAAAQPAPAANQSQAPQSANNQPEETPAALDPNQRVFVVSGNVDMAADSGECAVTAGDVLVRSGEPNGSKIAVSVVSSKKGDCAVGTNADVEVSDLQEMHNQFREKLDTGLKTLADNSGKNGLPKAPDTGTTGGEVPAPQPDADADGELQNQQKDAESAEQDVQKGSPGGK